MYIIQNCDLRTADTQTPAVPCYAIAMGQIMLRTRSVTWTNTSRITTEATCSEC